MPKPIDFIVIGGGIVGVSTARFLQRAAQHVLLIDRKPPGRETSYGNSGIIDNACTLPFGMPPYHHLFGVLLNKNPSVRVHFPTFLKRLDWVYDFTLRSRTTRRIENGRHMRPLMANAVADHNTLMEGTDAARYLTHDGRVKLHRSEKSFAAAQLERELAKSLSIPFDVLSAAEFCAQETALKPHFHKAVVWRSTVRLTNPGAVIGAYAHGFTVNGGRFVEDDVKALSPSSGGWQVRTGGGTHAARNIVVCAGPWSAQMLKPLGYRLPLAFKRGYHQHFGYTGPRLKHALVDADIGYLLCPMEQGLRLTTGAEFADLDAPPTPHQIAHVLPYARELAGFGEPVEQTPWMGSRPCFADSLPVIGSAARHKGLWFNFGHGHYGLTMGPSSGRLLAQLATGQKPFCDPTPYQPTRFGA